MKKPVFSVIIPTLNEEKFLPLLLASLASQTQKNFEVIVVDGSSKDKTVSIARSYQQKLPLLTIKVSKKASLPLQRNTGASMSKAPWLAFIDADSILMPYFFERVNYFIKNNKPELITTWFQPDSEKSGDAMFVLLGNMTIEASVMFNKPLSPGPLTLVMKDAYDKVGGYDESHAFHEDYDFGLRLHKAGVVLRVITESLYVVSLRRLRREGTLKVMQQYIKSALPVILFNKPLKTMRGYIMGGQLYNDKSYKEKRNIIKKYEYKLKKFIKETFKSSS